MTRSAEPGASLADDAGVTVVELIIAMSLLVFALGGFLGALARQQQTSNYAQERQRSLDDLRIAASQFDRDARQAVQITEATPTRMAFTQYSGPDIVDTVWEIFTDAEGIQLRRTRDGTAIRVFIVKLTNDTVFGYPDPANPPASVADIRQVQLFMSTQPLAKYPAVDLTTEVTLRNVRLNS